MELRHLRYFVGVADSLSFSGAATRLTVSQPALSRQIRDLEAELGVRLFNRVGRRISLTAEGEDLLVRCRALLRDSESLRERAHALAGGQIGVLRIGASATTMETVVPDLLTRFRRVRPGVDVHFIQDGAAALLTRVERGDIHLAITRFPAGRPLRSRLLFPVGVLAVMSSSHALRRSKTLEAPDLANESLLLLPRGFTTRELFDEACVLAQTKPQVLLEGDAPHALIALAAAAVGIAIVPSIVRPSQKKVRFVPVHHDRQPLGIWMAVTWDPHRFLPSYAETFVKEAVAHSNKSYPGKALRLAPPPLPPEGFDEE